MFTTIKNTILRAFLFCAFVLAATVSHCQSPAYKIAFIFEGESNAGGYGNNADATTGELSSQSQVQILHNYSLAFESLHIGVNNRIGHIGHESIWYNSHG